MYSSAWLPSFAASKDLLGGPPPPLPLNPPWWASVPGPLGTSTALKPLCTMWSSIKGPPLKPSQHHGNIVPRGLRGVCNWPPIPCRETRASRTAEDFVPVDCLAAMPRCMAVCIYIYIYIAMYVYLYIGNYIYIWLCMCVYV